MKNIAVFFGGKSCEHDISVITGVLTANVLDKELFNPIPIYVSPSGEWFTGEELLDVAFYKIKDFKKLKKVTFISGDNSLYLIDKKIKRYKVIACAINCLHGLNGEDGSLAGLLKLLNIPLASPSLFGSSFAIDKDYTKTVLTGMGVEKLPCVRILRSAYYQKKESAIKLINKRIDYPVIVKPSCLGSSIGIKVAFCDAELISALDGAFVYDDKVIVEKALQDFIELNCAAYKANGKIVVSEVEKPVKSQEILSFSDKYLGFQGLASREFPAKISEKLRNKVRDITEKVYRKAEFLGIIRIDYIYAYDKLYLNEINTVPGSLAYYLFSDTLKGFTDILSEIIDEAEKENRAYQSRNFVFDSSVLMIDGVKGSKQNSFDNKKN